MKTHQKSMRAIPPIGMHARVIVLLTALMFLSVLSVFPQTNWIKHEGNPVLEPGPEGSWDDQSVEECSVLLLGSLYHMWYGGLDGANFRIGHATSADGLTWTKDPLNPVLDIGPAGSWESIYVYSPCVIKVDTTFHMYYSGSDYGLEMIGHATSQDGSSWTKDPLNPVLAIGPVGSWDEWQVFPMGGSVIFDGSIFKMWYGGGDSFAKWCIGYATSHDGSTWIKDELHNPVIKGDTLGGWDSHSVIPGTVIFDGTKYLAWYSGCRIDLQRWQTGFATSPDGLTWVKDAVNSPVVGWGSFGSWDQDLIFDASVLYSGGDQSYKMWYTGGHFQNQGSIGFASCTQTGVDEDLPVQQSLTPLSITIYPNPSSGLVTGHWSLFTGEKVRVVIYDIYGREVAVVMDGVCSGDQVVRWDVTNLPAGVYFYRLRAEGIEQGAAGKLVIQ